MFFFLPARILLCILAMNIHPPPPPKKEKNCFVLTCVYDNFQYFTPLKLDSYISKAAVIKQDSILELLLQPPGATTAPTGRAMHSLWRDGGYQDACAVSTIGELALLQRQHSLLQEELLRLRDAESRFKDSERARAKLERQVRHMKVCSDASASQQMGDQVFNVRTVFSPHKAHYKNLFII